MLFRSVFRFGSNNNITMNLGNLVPGTAAKGINFTANTPAAGMTSQLLNWYEEGAWTPNQGSGVTLVGTFSSTGLYTRIGRCVTVRGTLSGSTSVAINSTFVLTSNLPFAASTIFSGMVNNNGVSSGACCTSGNSLYSYTNISAAPTIYFTITYFI